MNTLVTGDPHFSANPRDEYRWQFLEETLPQMIEKHDVRRLLILGDLTEVKDGHPSTLVNRLVDGIATLAEHANIYILRGNHDYRAEDVPFFRFVQHIPRVRWINDPVDFKLRGLGRCLFIPHQPNPEYWSSTIDPWYDWFFCHETFAGTKAETGHKLSGISRSVFPRGARVVSGDIHTPGGWYVGAPYTVDFGDAYEPRVFILDGKQKVSVPVPGPQKRLIEIAGKKPLVTLNKVKLDRGDIVKVRIELPPDSETSRAEVRARARDWAENAEVELAVTEVQAPRATTTKTARNRRRSSDTDLVHAYAKKMRKGKTTVLVGLKITKEVN